MEISVEKFNIGRLNRVNFSYVCHVLNEFVVSSKNVILLLIVCFCFLAFLEIVCLILTFLCGVLNILIVIFLLSPPTCIT